jgi:small-conductance mechanosensitive channel
VAGTIIAKRPSRCLLSAALTTVPVVCVSLQLTAQAPDQAGTSIASAVSMSAAGEPATFRYNNRTITVLRATVLSRPPEERARVAAELIDSLIRDSIPGPVTTRPLAGTMIVSVGARDIFAIFPLDLDQLAGETQESKAAQTVARLQQAVDEAVELRTPSRLVRATALALGATLLAAVLLWQIARLYRVLAVRIPSHAERHLQRLSAGDVQLARAFHAHDVLRYALTALFIGVVLFVTYSWLTFVLRRFPYTRPWGESLRTFLVDRLSSLALQFVHALPNLFTGLIIILLVRFAVGLARAIFRGVEEGRIAIPYVYRETAAPTRRLVTALLWLLGIAIAYPYLPGSDSDAFKGISVFVGLVVSLGSSGVVNQMMSGLTITYSRALRVGDYVRIGDIDGTVTQLGPLATKVKTPRGEEVTIPNAVVISQMTTNYSRLAATEGVYIPTTVTIGYDTPWRQIHALLLIAAERTPGVRAEPKPVVRQTALQDFYVVYTLLVCLEQPNMRAPVLDALHANIQDAFNEYGVQIMSPNYEADPDGRKIVRPEQWYAAPARRPAAGEPEPRATDVAHRQ